MRLKDKVAIITGAGQRAGEGAGNGRATALTFAREGARLLLANRSLPSLEETARLIAKEGFEAEIMTADVTVEADCQALMAAAMTKFGRIDILHNNVGIGSVDGDTTAIDRADWDATYAANVSGAMLLAKHVLPVMRRQKSGVITNVSSIAAKASIPLIAYKTSKAALNEFSRWLAFENAAHNIRCNVLMLGLIDTPNGIETYLREGGPTRADIRRERDARVPMGRMGTPWEGARVALFLASEDASYVTGAVIPVDGGLLTRVGG
jgi:NAD(P)-dependent dehydrogenase (short-subunit alcohol dehydrogenase family)